MFRSLTIIVLLILVSVPSCAFVVEWNRTYGSALSGIADIKAVENGFILAGYTGTVYDSDAWVIRTDAEGSELWNITFGAGDIDMASSIQKVADGYIIAGIYGGAFGDGWLIKIDFNGSLEWSRYYGTVEYERFWWVEVVGDVGDGLIIAGEKKSWGKPEDAWLVKVDREGNELWNRTYGGKGDDAALCVRKLKDGYIVAGFTESPGRGKDGWLIKVDKNGNVVWNATFGGKLDDSFSSVQVVPDGFILAGYTESTGGKKDVWVVKTDTNGRELWNVTFGGEGDDVASAVLPVGDGYLIAGFTESLGADKANRDAWLIKVDKNGKEVWNATFGGKGRESFSSIVQTSDGYVLAGSKDGRAWLVKVVEPGATEETKSSPGFEGLVAMAVLVLITLKYRNGRS